MAEFKAGDHLTVPLDSPKLKELEPYLTGALGEGIRKLAAHHGIYVGKDKVIHLSGDTGTAAVIRQDPIETFSNGRPVTVVSCDKSLPPEKVVEEAIRNLEHSADYPPYDLLENNCEHFVNLCKKGEKTSSQAQALKIAALFGGCALDGIRGATEALLALEKASTSGSLSSSGSSSSNSSSSNGSSSNSSSSNGSSSNSSSSNGSSSNSSSSSGSLLGSFSSRGSSLGSSQSNNSTGGPDRQTAERRRKARFRISGPNATARRSDGL